MNSEPYRPIYRWKALSASYQKVYTIIPVDICRPSGARVKCRLPRRTIYGIISPSEVMRKVEGNRKRHRQNNIMGTEMHSRHQNCADWNASAPAVFGRDPLGHALAVALCEQPTPFHLFLGRGIRWFEQRDRLLHRLGGIPIALSPSPFGELMAWTTWHTLAIR